MMNKRPDWKETVDKILNDENYVSNVVSTTKNDDMLEIILESDNDRKCEKESEDN